MMIRRFSHYLSIVLFLVPLPARAETGQTQTVDINSFESEEDLAATTANHVKIQSQSEHVTDGRHALRIEFESAEWPNLLFQAPDAGWNWSRSAALAIDVANPNDASVPFSIRIDDDPRADGSKHCRTGGGHARAGRGTTTFVLPLGSAEPMNYGMRGLPGYPGTAMAARGEIDPAHITAFQIFMHHPEKPTALVIDNIRLLPPPLLEGIVDRFGQFTGSDWPGKVASDSELAARLAAEEAAIAKSPRLPDRNEYGGWASGPQLDATRFFRTEKLKGKWWLVTPDGRLFFSLGADCVGTHNPTILEQRESMFTWLPAADDPLAKFFGKFNRVHRGPVAKGRTYDFFQANLRRKYGPDFLKSWRVLAAERLHSWGFNTIGNWSDWAMFDLKSVPYTVPLHVGGDHARLSSGSDYWAKMHDPFDPQFAADAEKSFRAAKRFRDDPWCLGYFVDNELSWGGGTSDQSRYGLAIHALAAGSEQPAKQEFVRALRKQYVAIEKLNQAWNIDLANWDALERAPYTMPKAYTAAMRIDCGAFSRQFARRYFMVVRDAIASQDPNHLYLGCRFSTWTPEAIAAAVEICPVVSFNIYAAHIDLPNRKFLLKLDKPCLIGEFHFGALDRGMFHTGLVGTAGQSERAAAYQSYVRSVIDHPNFVGCHWFQFVDQPITGRVHDGENYNIGFLSVTDTPYREIVEAAKKVHSEAYSRRARTPQ